MGETLQQNLMFEWPVTLKHDFLIIAVLTNISEISLYTFLQLHILNIKLCILLNYREDAIKVISLVAGPLSEVGGGKGHVTK